MATEPLSYVCVSASEQQLTRAIYRILDLVEAHGKQLEALTQKIDALPLEVAHELKKSQSYMQGELQALSSKVDDISVMLDSNHLHARIYPDADLKAMECDNTSSKEVSWGMGQTGIIPSSFFGDLDTAAQAAAHEQTQDAGYGAATSMQPVVRTVVSPSVGNALTNEELTAAEIKKRRNRILASVPGVHTANPIAAVTNFCRHHLKFDVDFKIDEQPSGNPSEPLYVVDVLFPEGESIGRYCHTRKKYAKEMAAKEALRRINEDEQLLSHYIEIAFTRA